MFARFAINQKAAIIMAAREASERAKGLRLESGALWEMLWKESAAPRQQDRLTALTTASELSQRPSSVIREESTTGKPLDKKEEGEVQHARVVMN